MFAKVDEYIEIVKNQNEPVENRIKKHQFAVKRMAKIKKDIEKMHKDISEHEPVEENITDKINWEKEIDEIQDLINNIQSNEPDKITQKYIDLMNRLATLKGILEKQELEIKEIIEDGDNLKPIDIPNLNMNNVDI